MPRYLYVDDISLRKSGKKTIQATATITIKEVDGRPVQNAIFHAHWSGMTTDVDSGFTNKKGKVSFASDRVKGNGTFTITVDDVVKYGWIYDSDSNNETSDSI